MAKTVEIQIYSYEELSDGAKQKALDDNRDWDLQVEWWDGVYEGVISAWATFGLTVGTSSLKFPSGLSRSKPDIWFSGFGHQGQGSCFGGHYEYKEGGLEALKTELPSTYVNEAGEVIPLPRNSELHKIVERLEAMQKEWTKAVKKYHIRCLAEDADEAGEEFLPPPVESIDPSNIVGVNPNLSVSIKANERWYSIEVAFDDQGVLEEEDELLVSDDELESIFRDLNHWLFKALESEYDYLSSDEVIAESLICSEVEFRVDGSLHH